ncbi:SETD6 [Bugula neritina]|uniref:SETD6 n=1 Tax=Bugula neritina TaxID=10212 RepID=A0A7J7JVP6_BUGNE|nr:SETD6 [Bugula neritina]
MRYCWFYLVICFPSKMPKTPRRKQTLRAQRSQRTKDEWHENLETDGSGRPTSITTNTETPTESSHSTQLQKFLSWAKRNGIVLNDKVICCDEAGGVSANYGMMAADDIKKGENIFILPRPAALTPHNSAIAEFIQQNEDSLRSNSGWLPLILALMYERLNPESKWREYLDTFPNFHDMELPMFWPLSELDSELSGTGMVHSVATDIQNMRKEFEEVLLPVIERNPEIFRHEKFRDFQFAKQTSAFIMAYSFTDDITSNQDDEDDSDDEADSAPSTIMVPMADLLNHVPDHNAELNVGEATFRMIAVKDIRKGEEIYNTYGKISNYTLLLMYGFCVKPLSNPYNTTELRLPALRQACEQTGFPDAALRFDWLDKKLATECADYDGTMSAEVKNYINRQSICLHVSGLCDSSSILKSILKVLRMDREELEAKLAALNARDAAGDAADSDEDEEWLSDDEEDFDISKDKLSNMDSVTKVMLSKVADIMLDELSSPSGADESKLTRKQLYSKYVRDGQILQLKNLKQWLTWYD